MKTITKFAAIGVVTMASFAPQTASALNFKYNGQNNGSADVQYTRGAPPGDGVVNGNSSAGIFSMEDVTPGGLGEFLAWCFDVDTFISEGPHTYTENSALLDNSPPYLNPDAGPGAKERVQKLFDKSYDPDDILGSNAKSAGFQIAIWEVLYDNDYNLDLGSFMVTGGNADAIEEAKDFLIGADTYGGPRQWAITTYGAGTSSQDLGVATAIPLPAAAWLLMFASGGLLAAKRRQARRAA